MHRPTWARWLDRIALPTAKLLGMLIRRPDDRELHALAGHTTSEGSTHPTQAAADHIQKGRAALESEALGEALHHFGQAIACEPEARWAWHGRGDALQLSGQPAEAQRAYEHAIALDATCGLHHAGRANALKALGMDTEAQAAFEEALRLDPSLTWMQSP